MANPKHLKILRQGVTVWNDWRARERFISPNLRKANLEETNLHRANLREADLRGANLFKANVFEGDLRKANLAGACLHGANLAMADLREATLNGADLYDANLYHANLHGAHLHKTTLNGANLTGANLKEAALGGANLNRANLAGANLAGATLVGANLIRAVLVEADFADALLNGCKIYGVSAWGVKLSEHTKQQGLIITPPQEPAITVDDLEVAQFVYLLLHNEKIRRVIDTVGKKSVLLLGQFTEGRIVVLEHLRDELRKRGYLPIVFNFDKPETKDFTETVRLLAGLSKFVIADLSGPKSAPYELGAIISQTMIPFQPIITAGERPFAMLRDLLSSYSDRVFQPIEYSSVDRLIETMDAEIIGPAETRFDELVMRRAETLKVRRV